MGWWKTFFLIRFVREVTTTFLSIKKMDSVVLSLNTNGLGETLRHKKLRHMESISQSYGFIEGFHCLVMLRCFKPEMLRDLSIQSN